MTISDVVKELATTPFLFIGSGITRRYYNLPAWKGLLEHFAFAINDDPFTYSSYENKAKTADCPVGIMPKIAELIQRDYDEKWFAGAVERTADEEVQKRIISEGLSPFKAEVAAFVKHNSIVNENYRREIEKLTEISEKSIAGVITTNYDSFIEDHFQGFKKYVGQNQLIFSSIQGVAEIYKIHGSVEDPDSIVINDADYREFDAKRSYLAAKLMTIFMEYPIIFMGYSISDVNILNILKSIVNCLDSDQLKSLEKRFVFVEYDSLIKEMAISPYTIMIDSKPLNMTKISLGDFLPLYEAIGEIRAKLPVRILRRFKQELYSYVLTNTPTSTLRVAPIDDYRISDQDYVLAVGRTDQLGVQGLNGIKGDDWYRNVVLGDLPFTADEMLEYAYPVLIRQNSNRLPLNKYLSLAKEPHPECEEAAINMDLDTIIPQSIRKYRGTCEYHSIMDVWRNESARMERVTRLISELQETEMDVQELEDVLKQIFQEREVLKNAEAPERSQIRRLIMIYDYLKWGKSKRAS